MHILIVCGTPWCNTSSIQAALEAAGVRPAKAATSGSIATPAVWHDRFGADTTPGNPGASTQRARQPGKAWELAASEIFLANWEQPLWGWTDHRSTWLLDFWLNFDPQTRFVLVHTPAAQVLAKAAADVESGTFNANETLHTWCEYQRQMLQFYHRHRDRCAWILDHTHSQPEAWLPTLPAEWGLNTHVLSAGQAAALLTLASEEQLPVLQPYPLDLLQALAVQAVQQNEPAQALQSEILATLPECTAWPDLIGTTEAPLDAAQALEQVREQALVQHRDTNQKLEQAAQSRKALEAVLAKNTQAQAEQTSALSQQLQQGREQAEKIAQENTSLQTQLRSEAQAKADLQIKLDAETKAKKDATEEAELLLLQLHQVQEELEAIFLQSARLQTQQEADAKVRAELKAQLDAETKAKVNLQAQLSSDTKAKADLQTKLDAETKAKADLQAQLSSDTKAKADLQSKLNAEAQAKSSLQTQLNADVKARAELQSALGTETQAKKEAAEEAELLLLQLHQVQEELEHYFLQHQQAQQDKQQLQARLTRWAQRYPDHCEWDSLAVLPDTPAGQQAVLISALQHGGRALGQVHIALRHAKKHHTLLLTRQPDQPLPLLSWQTHGGASAGEGGTPSPAAVVAIHLSGAPGTPEATAVAQLAPTDLQLLKATCKAIASNLPANSPHHSAWVGHWQTAAAALDNLPVAWRFDALSLRHEQVNPDYEHLWLRFTNAHYGPRHWPEFEFRLSASNVRKKQFSTLPKLEFPLPEANGPKQFEHWFEESEDDKGPKFELRFDMKSPAMDMHCWNTLSPQDQAQAIELIEQLPHFLDKLEAAGTHIHRPWTEWHTLAEGIQHALTTCLNLSPTTSGHEPVAAAAI